MKVFIRGHCGPDIIDPEACCPFCGDTVIGCAKAGECGMAYICTDCNAFIAACNGCGDVSSEGPIRATDKAHGKYIPELLDSDEDTTFEVYCPCGKKVGHNTN